MKKMLSGIKPSGQLTLGNYIGALRNFVKYQDEYEMIVFIANLHCITVPQDPIELRKNLKDAIALYLACGLDPERSTIFLQSDVMEHAQLGFIMCCSTYMGELNRMTQFKDKQAKGETNLTGGLYTYPALMAADILIYDPEYVPVGEDQKQHVELTRDLALRFNNRYNCELFKVPEPVVPKVGARIMSLSEPTKKMSKSDKGDKGCIHLLDDLNVARKKIMSAVTDNVGKVNYDPVNQPGVSNLLEIMSSLQGTPIEELVKQFENVGYGEFKKAVADVVIAELEKIQTKYNEIIASGKIEEVLEQGAQKARTMAHKKLMKVQKKIGIEIR
ncbi:tryptophan--tRNA ligase [Anaerorhabdus sp.]|uniref:tryptophan--tRNA ligase n=1 Tax=Anaerorhabdus sp. TaxID=1872524 RepID=UPI002FC84151